MESLIVDPWVVSALPEAGWRLWAFLVTMSVMGGLILYFGFGSILYYCFYIRRRKDPEAWKLQPKRFCSPKLHRWAIGVAAATAVAIGGLKSQHVAQVLSVGAGGIAVVSAICGQPDPAAAARALVEDINAFRLQCAENGFQKR